MYAATTRTGTRPPAGGGELHWYRAGADVSSRTTEKMRDLGPVTALAAKEVK
ncbi:hypothetical protein [Corynebacterium sp. CCUG 69979]|uniref:hypothetical protein n=1 Tax=Corynebacterium sp. CCUG 69979 TaxID=2823890 RepID=UPI00210DB4D8|nr:hypothetical protein [Corynebacterium sp. CCUG 69979]